jgi:glycosyltransferase involved in cell wall biosynthesis
MTVPGAIIHSFGDEPAAAGARGTTGDTSHQQRLHLTVVLPAYNEAAIIRASVLAVDDALTGVDRQIVVVDDGSSDDTFEQGLSVTADGLPVSVVRHPVNMGKGAALARGFGAASGELVAFLDADLEIPPHYLHDMIRMLEEGDVDVVVGVREEAAERSFPWARRAMSRAYRWLVRWLFGLTVSETQAGIKLFRREVLEACVPRLAARRFAFDVELLAAAHRFGYRIGECPVKVDYSRDGKLGRLSPSQVAQMFVETLGVYYRSSFWTWLQPGANTKVWMLAFGLGIFLFGMGVAKLLTPLVLQGPVKQAFSIVALQFLPRYVRDWLLAVSGLAVAVVALVQLNRSLMDAFARVDRGDLAGILQIRAASSGVEHQTADSDAEGKDRAQ